MTSLRIRSGRSSRAFSSALAAVEGRRDPVVAARDSRPGTGSSRRCPRSRARGPVRCRRGRDGRSLGRRSSATVCRATSSSVSRGRPAPSRRGLGRRPARTGASPGTAPRRRRRRRPRSGHRGARRAPWRSRARGPSRRTVARAPSSPRRKRSKIASRSGDRDAGAVVLDREDDARHPSRRGRRGRVRRRARTSSRSRGGSGARARASPHRPRTRARLGRLDRRASTPRSLATTSNSEVVRRTSSTRSRAATFELHPPGFELRDVEEVAHVLQERLRVALDDLEIAPPDLVARAG